MRKLDWSDFLKELKETFPQLRDELNQQDGLLILEITVFTNFVQSLINAGEKDLLLKAFHLVDKYLREGNREVVNDLGVSFLEHLNFTDGKAPRSWAMAYMPSNLRSEYDSLKRYNEKLASTSRTGKTQK